VFELLHLTAVAAANISLRQITCFHEPIQSYFWLLISIFNCLTNFFLFFR